MQPRDRSERGCEEVMEEGDLHQGEVSSCVEWRRVRRVGGDLRCELIVWITGCRFELALVVYWAIADHFGVSKNTWCESQIRVR